MDWLRILAARVSGLFGRRSSEEELGEEVREHLELLAEENVRRGMSPAEARFAARREFGGVEQTKELYRDRRGLPWFDTLLQDTRFGLRMLRKSPGFTAVAVLTLALGIGANTAIFSVVDAVLLRPLAFQEPDRLAAVWQNNTRQHVKRGRVSPANLLDWQQRNRAFSSLVAITYWSFDYTGAGDPESLLGEYVTQDFFGLLGVQAAHGRTFTPDEYELGKHHVIVLSHGLWERRFGSDPSVVGTTISLSNQTWTIVGILPPDFTLPWLGRDREVYAPYVFNKEERAYRSGGYLNVLGRLKPGVTWDQAQQEMDSVSAELARAYPQDDAGVGVTLVPLDEQTVGKVRPMLVLLWGAVGFVLLIACANVANLLLSRGNSRQRELAVRAALGATRGRLLRQLFIESCLLALIGCGCGLLLALWCQRIILTLGKAEIPRIGAAAMDARVFAFAVAVALVTAVFFGLTPAWQVLRTDLQGTLKEGGKTGATSPGRHRLRGALVVTEVALALMLLAGAGLLLRSFYNVLQVNLGFAPDHLVAMNMYVWTRYTKPEQRILYVQQALANVSSLAGVQAAGVASSPPLLLGGGGAPASIKISGEAAIREDQKPAALMNIVTPGYFAAMGTPLLRGRAFSDFDRAGSAPVVLVNQTMSRRYWAGQDPIGRKITVPVFSGDYGVPPVECEIVGIVGDVRQSGPEREAEAEFYRPFLQDPTGSIAFVARTRSDPTAAMKSIESAIWQVDKTVPFYVATTMDELLTTQFRPRYFTLVLLGGLAALALALAAIGIYGVISYATSQRTQEIGIRMALGAQTSHVLRLVIRQGMLFVLAGVIIGLAGSFALKHIVADLLFGVTPGDPVTFAGVAAILSVVALLACYIPARRATRVDPLIALRYE